MKKGRESRSDRVDPQHPCNNNDNDDDSTIDDPIVVPVPEVMTNRALYDFLRTCGTGHMGWRGAGGESK